MSLYGLKLHLRRHGQRAHVAHPVTSSYDLFIKLWNVDNAYHNFATLRGHDHSVSSARFLPGDTHILSSSRDATVRIWEISTTSVVSLRPSS